MVTTANVDHRTESGARRERPSCEQDCQQVRRPFKSDLPLRLPVIGDSHYSVHAHVSTLAVLQVLGGLMWAVIVGGELCLADYNAITNIYFQQLPYYIFLAGSNTLFLAALEGQPCPSFPGRLFWRRTENGEPFFLSEDLGAALALLTKHGLNSEHEKHTYYAIRPRHTHTSVRLTLCCTVQCDRTESYCSK